MKKIKKHKPKTLRESSTLSAKAQNIMPFFSAGFTLIEMLVVLAVISLISLLTFVSYPKISESKNLERAGEEIVLNLRKAQGFAMATKEFGKGSGVFPSYGVFFDSDWGNTYVLFADTNGNNLYDGQSEKAEELTLKGSLVIELCAFLKTAPDDLCGLGEFNIVFASSTALSINAQYPNGAPVDILGNDADIKITVSGQTKTIVIFEDTGQIYVE